jgi:hypothetical protein
MAPYEQLEGKKLIHKQDLRTSMKAWYKKNLL